MTDPRVPTERERALAVLKDGLTWVENEGDAYQILEDALAALVERVEAAEKDRDYWNADRNNKIAGEYQDLILRLTAIAGALADANAPLSAGPDEPLWSEAKRVRLLGEAAVSAEARAARYEEALRRIVANEELNPAHHQTGYVSQAHSLARAVLAGSPEEETR